MSEPVSAAISATLVTPIESKSASVPLEVKGPGTPRAWSALIEAMPQPCGRSDWKGGPVLAARGGPIAAT